MRNKDDDFLKVIRNKTNQKYGNKNPQTKNTSNALAVYL